MKITAYLVKAFSKEPVHGNPAGVVLDADLLTESQMLLISSKLGFSESVFVSKSDKANFKLRFFTPKKEVDLCGHATIAAFSLMNSLSILKSSRVTQETKAGILPIEIGEDGRVTMAQKPPEFGFIEKDKTIVAQLLSISKSEILNSPIQSVSTGTSKLLIPISNLNVLMYIKPNFEGISNYCLSKEVNGFYPFTAETINSTSDFHTRQFNPLAGIDEDPITGVAAGALGAYAKRYNLVNRNNLTIEQGYIMNKGGLVYVDVDSEIRVGGYGVLYDETHLDIA